MFKYLFPNSRFRKTDTFLALRYVGKRLFTRDPAKVERLKRDTVIRLLQNKADDISFQRNGLSWNTRINDSGLILPLFVDGHFQGDDLQRFVQLAKSLPKSEGRSVLIDVGANIGTTSIPAARMGFRVIAIEPSHQVCRYLRRNVEANNLQDQITIRNCAVSTKNGRAKFVNHSGNIGGGEIVIGSGAGQGFGEIGQANTIEEVEVRSLESILHEEGISANAVLGVWSDTQGHEAKVIESGASVWIGAVPLFVEVWPDGLEQHGGIAHFLAIAEKHFDCFLPSSDMAGAQAKWRDVKDLAGFIREMQTNNVRERDIVLATGGQLDRYSAHSHRGPVPST